MKKVLTALTLTIIVFIGITNQNSILQTGLVVKSNQSGEKTGLDYKNHASFFDTKLNPSIHQTANVKNNGEVKLNDVSKFSSVNALLKTFDTIGFGKDFKSDYSNNETAENTLSDTQLARVVKEIDAAALHQFSKYAFVN